MWSKYVSQKRNESIDKNQWYNILLNFVLYFASTLKNVYSVISVIVDSLPSNTKKGIDPFVASRVQFFHSWAVYTCTCTYAYMYIYICTCICTCIRICESTPGLYSLSVICTCTHVNLYIYKHIHTILHTYNFAPISYCLIVSSSSATSNYHYTKCLKKNPHFASSWIFLM